MYRQTGIGPDDLISFLISDCSGENSVTACLEIGFCICSGALRRHAITIRMAPAMIIGTDSSIPMVSPPHKNPSCGSGSRKNSPVMRARP